MTAPEFVITQGIYEAAVKEIGREAVDAKLKELGIRITTDEEANGPDSALLCQRVEDVPIPRSPMGSYQEPCVECGEQVWVCRISPLGPKRVCNRCISKVMAKGGGGDGHEQGD